VMDLSGMRRQIQHSTLAGALALASTRARGPPTATRVTAFPTHRSWPGLSPAPESNHPSVDFRASRSS
jgi:hypothetical protein